MENLPAELSEPARLLCTSLQNQSALAVSLLPALVSIVSALRSGTSPVDRVNLGDLLTAVSDLPPAVEHSTWRFNPDVGPEVFAALDYASASSGITMTQRDNRPGWWNHAQRNRAFIMSAAALVQDPRLAVVFGAGKAFDLPLVDLAKRFQRVVLIDIDAAALEETSEAVVRDNALRRRLELRKMDLSGVSEELTRGIQRALGEARDGAQAEQELRRLCQSYCLEQSPRFLALDERADFVVSGMVLTQLALQPKLLAKRSYEQRFGAIPHEAHLRWGYTWDELDLRIQQDHINALLDQAEIAVITTDVVHDSTTVDSSGLQRTLNRPWSTIGTELLDERIPRFIEIAARSSWRWPRIRPRPPSHDGVLTTVNALALRLGSTSSR